MRRLYKTYIRARLDTRSIVKPPSTLDIIKVSRKRETSSRGAEICRTAAVFEDAVVTTRERFIEVLETNMIGIFASRQGQVKVFL